MRTGFISVVAACLAASPACADDIGGITVGMSRDEARSVLATYGTVIESPTIQAGPGRGGSSMEAGRYSVILCDNAVAMASRDISSGFVTFASMVHSKQDVLGHAPDANANTLSGREPYGSIHLTWTRPHEVRYTLSYRQDGEYETVTEGLYLAPARLCIPLGIKD